MTIVVVREEPAGGSGAAVPVLATSAFVGAGFGASAVAGAGTAVDGAPVEAVEDVVDVSAGFVGAGPAVDCDSAAEEARANARRRAVIGKRGFMTGETIGRSRRRQAAGAHG